MKFCRNSYFIIFWPVVFTWSFLIKTTNLTELNGNLPDPQVLSRILNEFVKPMIQSISLDSTSFRSSKETAVEKAVRARILELQEFLQDSDVNNYDTNNISGGNDKTAMREFLSKTKTSSNKTKLNLFQYNLDKYNKITHKIEKALIKESISEKTKSLILKTLDVLVKKLIEGQCNWKRTRLDKTEGPYIIVNKWKAAWQDIKNTIGLFLASDPRRNENSPKYLDNLHMILKNVSRDVDLLTKKYKIHCDFLPKVPFLSETENPENSLRNKWDKAEMEGDRCRYFLVCSGELRIFMLNFYKNLNDTTVSVVRNYADMYNKEGNSKDVKEKRHIVSLLIKISNDLQGYISEVFIKETKKFKLDKKKNPDSNIKFIKDYIKNNIKHVKEKVRKILRTQLINIRKKIVAGIREDIQVNLGVDLGNLEQEFLKQICTSFSLCSRNYIGRRQNLFTDGVNKNNVNVEVQLTFDDLLPSYRRLQRLPLNKITKFFQYVSNVSVTRTTLMSKSTLK